MHNNIILVWDTCMYILMWISKFRKGRLYLHREILWLLSLDITLCLSTGKHWTLTLTWYFTFPPLLRTSSKHWAASMWSMPGSRPTSLSSVIPASTAGSWSACVRGKYSENSLLWPSELRIPPLYRRPSTVPKGWPLKCVLTWPPNLKTSLYSVVWTLDPVPNIHITWLANSIIW